MFDEVNARQMWRIELTLIEQCAKEMPFMKG
jgi:hypothetical protein